MLRWSTSGRVFNKKAGLRWARVKLPHYACPFLEEKKKKNPSS